MGILIGLEKVGHEWPGRKVLANTIQRVPDGELTTQYDHASREHILLQYIFDNKVMSSEIDGIDMMSNLTKAFKMSFIYAFAPVRTGFERDFDDDPRSSSASSSGRTSSSTPTAWIYAGRPSSTIGTT